MLTEVKCLGKLGVRLVLEILVNKIQDANVRVISRILVCFILLFSFSVAFADRGMIPVIPNVSVYEPEQKAIVAWNGLKEVLILPMGATLPGDRNGDGKITIDELQYCITKFLGITPAPNPPHCEQCCDLNCDGKVTIDELQRTINAFLGTKELVRPDFSNYYHLEQIDIPVNVPEYSLPLNIEDISNYSTFIEKIPLNEKSISLLKNNGFVIIKNPFNEREEDIIFPYTALRENNIPIFITSDSLLHLYHIQFDETLRQIEEKEFYDRIWHISERLLNKMQKEYNNSEGEAKEAIRKNIAFLSVGLSLLKPREDQLCQGEKWECLNTDAYFTEEELYKYQFKIPELVKDEVISELELIDRHEGFSGSPIFIYKEDYSQYVPRGHYTRSEKLKNYFKAMMWYGRIAFLLKGCEPACPLCDCLITFQEAKTQTLAASIISNEISNDSFLMENWERIYAVTCFYVGYSDDLGPYEYIGALNAVFNGKFDPNNFNDEKFLELKTYLVEKFPSPKIYGGTGQCEIPDTATPELIDSCIEKTKGLRLMGQRFIPDSYMFTRLVGFAYKGNKEPFTKEISMLGPIRGFPRGLDVMAILGSERAKNLLRELDDDNYEYYDEEFKKLKEQFDRFTIKDWNKNLYWSWLYSLKSLIKNFSEGYPTFMQTEAWHNKELTTALASWAQLRHDTILYAKQSYTPVATGLPPELPEVVGYVEPVPEFYNRLLALTRMTNTGLDKMDVLDDASKSRLENLEDILERLIELSKNELENKPLSQADYEFINDFADKLEAVIAEVKDKAKKTTIIADVHTYADSYTGVNLVLEEGTGYVKMIVVAYKLPDGRILMGAGPVFSYYEFKHPMSDRLTDEAWREKLLTKPPKDPEWVNTFTAP